MRISTDVAWMLFGFTAQFVFFARFIVQWIYAERKKVSAIPIMFWYLSIAGAIMLFTYSLHQRDPVFASGQAVALLIYLRNLVLIRREKAYAE